VALQHSKNKLNNKKSGGIFNGKIKTRRNSFQKTKKLSALNTFECTVIK